MIQKAIKSLLMTMKIKNMKKNRGQPFNGK